MRLAFLGPLLPAILIAGCVMFGFRRGDLVEGVPAGYENLPLPAGWHEIRPQTVADTDRICRALGANAHDAFNKQTIEGCAPTSIHAVIYPAAGGPLDSEALQVLRNHEVLHAYGIDHGPNGKGWANLPPVTTLLQPNALQPASSLAQLPPSQPNAMAPIPRGLFGSSAR